MRKWVIAGSVGLLALLVVLWSSKRPGGPAPSRPGTSRPVSSPRLPQTADVVHDSRSGTLAAGVIDPGGTPLADAWVTVTAVDGRAWLESLVAPAMARGTTDAHGVARFEDLPPGRYALAAGASDRFGPANLGGVEVRPGEVTSVELRLHGQGLRLSGTIQDSQGGPLPTARVMARPSVALAGANAGLIAAAVDQQGRYQMMLRPGGYQLVVDANGYATASQGLEVYADTTKNVRLDAESRLAGLVVLRDSNDPVEGAEVWVTAVDEGFYFRSASTASGADGSFEIGGLRGGNYVVSAKKGRLIGERRQAVAVGDRRSVRVQVDEGLAVAGRVVDASGAAVAGAKLQCAGAQITPIRRDGAVHTAVSGADGAFLIEGLHPAAYNLTVHATGFAVMRQPLRLVDRDIRDLAVALVAAASVVGRTIDAAGAAVAGARVTAAVERGSAMGWSGSYGSAISDDAGGFRIDGLGPGRLSLRAEHPRAGTVQVGPQETPAAGQTIETVLRLVTGSGIAGTVRGSDGQPVPGAQVDIRFEGAPPPWMNSEMVTGADGRYAFFGVPTGTALLSASRGASNSARLKSRERAREQTVQLAAGESKTVDLDLPAQGRTLAGRVLTPDGQPAVGAIVIASVSARKPREGQDRVSVGPDGRFVFDDVDGLAHTVWATHPDYAETKLVRQMPGNEILIRLTAGSGLEGNVVAPDGRPARDFLLVIGRPEQIDTVDAMRLDVHDPEGHFEVGHLADGPFDVQAQTPAGLLGRAAVVLGQGRPSQVRIAVQPVPKGEPVKGSLPSGLSINVR
jgi:protocatechuate 3,4-dioxygenase beta subunit